MPMYTLIEYSDNYSKTSGALWQKNVVFFADNAGFNPFKMKQKMTGQTGECGKKMLK